MHRRIPRRHLMGPGPAPVEPAVLAAMQSPVIGPLDPVFAEITEQVAADLRHVFRTRNRVTFPVSGSGSAGMEAALTNTVGPGDQVVVGVCGVFGARMADMARRAGGKVTVVEAPWGEPVPTHAVARAARERKAAVVALVHAETSTGTRQPIEELRRALGTDPLLVVDAVTSLAGMQVEVDDWGIDVCFAATQQCLSAPPGLAPITFSDRALSRARERSQPTASWYFDVGMLERTAAGPDPHHHTAPISMVYALAEALRLVRREGLEQRWLRHDEAGRFLQAQLIEMGFDMLAAPRYRLPQLTAARLPAGIDDAAIRSRLLADFSIEVGGGLGPLAGKLWRIGLMGRGATRNSGVRLVQAIEAVLGRQTPTRSGPQ